MVNPWIHAAQTGEAPDGYTLIECEVCGDPGVKFNSEKRCYRHRNRARLFKSKTTDEGTIIVGTPTFFHTLKGNKKLKRGFFSQTFGDDGVKLLGYVETRGWPAFQE